jgi:hypothetical protein
LNAIAPPPDQVGGPPGSVVADDEVELRRLATSSSSSLPWASPAVAETANAAAEAAGFTASQRCRWDLNPHMPVLQTGA